MDKSTSKFFEFEKEIAQKNILLSEFKGWNGLLVMKISMLREAIFLTESYFKTF